MASGVDLMTTSIGLMLVISKVSKIVGPILVDTDARESNEVPVVAASKRTKDSNSDTE